MGEVFLIVAEHVSLLYKHFIDPLLIDPPPDRLSGINGPHNSDAEGQAGR